MNREELNSTLNDLIPAFENFINAVKLLIDEEKRLKAENDGLKSQLDFEVQKRETVEAENEKLKDYSRRMKNQRENYYKGFVKIRNALEDVRESFNCFRLSMTPFHIGNKEELPHRMADIIQEHCNNIIQKINEV